MLYGGVYYMYGRGILHGLPSFPSDTTTLLKPPGYIFQGIEMIYPGCPQGWEGSLLNQ